MASVSLHVMIFVLLLFVIVLFLIKSIKLPSNFKEQQSVRDYLLKKKADRKDVDDS